MKVALVYDRVNKYGGAERVLEALHGLWPEAPLYTAVYDPKGAPWARDFSVRTTLLQRVPFFRSRHEFLPYLAQPAFEALDLTAFDTVISVTSEAAKAVITRPGQLHVCYCLTPTRYLWSGFEDYIGNPGLGFLDVPAAWLLQKTAPVLRQWDLAASARPDYFIPISEEVGKRLVEYYGVTPEPVIYPPVDLEKLRKLEKNPQIPVTPPPRDFYLLVSRLVGYKRVDIVISAFRKLDRTLVVIGSGHDLPRLREIAPDNVRFLDAHLTEPELVHYYKTCRAFVFAGREDFGLAAAEAQALGKAVIAFSGGGVAEIVIPGQTGLLFDRQTPEAVAAAITRFEAGKVSSRACRENARRFDLGKFRKDFRARIEFLYRKMKESNL